VKGAKKLDMNIGADLETISKKYSINVFPDSASIPKKKRDYEGISG
jgi:hypothetical protein